MKSFRKPWIIYAAALLLCLLLAACTAAPPESQPGTEPSASSDYTESTEPAAPTSPDTPPETEPAPLTLPTGFLAEDDKWVYTAGDFRVFLDPDSGFVTGFETSEGRFSCGRILVDAGVNASSLFSQLGYKTLAGLATYELPLFYPRMRALPEYRVTAVAAVSGASEGFDVTFSIDGLFLTYRYRLCGRGLALSVLLETNQSERLTIEGVGFVVQGLDGFAFDSASFEYPGSTPGGRQSFAKLMRYKATSADYSAPVIQIADATQAVNILFVDEVEKWTTGAYFDEAQRPCGGFMAAVEGWLSADAPMEVGTLYLLPVQDTAGDRANTDTYAEILPFWASLGYHTPQDTAESSAASASGSASAETGADTGAAALSAPYAIYSAHPYGTMDTGYFNRLTLTSYAERIDHVAAMGFDSIWLLPVFKHTGDNVYEPIDQGVIDPRYGGEEGAAVFIEKAHALGLSVLFDFVPHGPRPHYAFAKEHDAWISKDPEGNNRIEWDCVSMDYNHPEYYQYNQELAAYYAAEFGLDGGRIDCSMGGLPNWYSSEGLRASAAGLMAGRNVVRALREGFLSAHGSVLLLPENFHPIPSYAEVTDVFYDMPLYREIYNLQHSGLSETAFVSNLTQFLRAEHAVSVDGQLKLRFLGNHDTVTWTFDAARAQVVYGTEKAKALWMVLGWIDGVFFIYQGDEAPGTYKLKGTNLESFFTQLIDAKKSFLPHSMDTEYLDTGSPIFAFVRRDPASGESRLVLVNLSSTASTYSLAGELPIPENAAALCAIGEYSREGDAITLAPYSGVIFDLP